MDMTRVDEIEGRLAVHYVGQQKLQEGDIAYLLAEVKRLEGELNFERDQSELRRHDAIEFRALALSLAEALRMSAAAVQLKGWGALASQIEAVLSDPRLAKIRGK